jgi:protein-S-isoprenylcysteine O-methyltransferase Ste14
LTERSLFWRALAAFMMLPGLVAGLIPFVLRPQGRPLSLPGVLLLAVGGALLLWCVRDFYVRGRGTLAPWDPPRTLVVVGLYRFTRNPMYVAVLTVLAGWAIAYGSTVLAAYAGLIAIVFHLRVVLGEEPWLARTHGDEWRRYAARVPRWLL